MGQKSRTKKVRTPQQAAAQKINQQRPQPKAPAGMQLASLSGGTAPVAQATPAATAPKNTAFASVDHVRQDIAQITVLLGIVGALLIILVLVNDKTTLLHQAGSQLASFLKFT